MDNPWPAICTAGSLVLLLWMIVRWQMQAFVALVVASLVLGVAAGMPPEAAVRSVTKGIGDLLREVAVILALGAMLGRMLEASGAAETIARTLVDRFGPTRTPTALLLAAFLVGIPVLFNVGFLILIPIVYRLQRRTGESLLWYLVPTTLGLTMTHSLVPPHPGVVGAVRQIAGDQAGRVMVETIVFGTPLAFAMALVGWLTVGRFWASRQHVEPPEAFVGKFAERAGETPRPSFALSVTVVVLPLALSLMGFALKLGEDLGLVPGLLRRTWAAGDLPAWLGVLRTTPADWIRFVGDPTSALLIATGVAFWLLGGRQGFGRAKLLQIGEKGVSDVGAMVFLFGAAGGFKETIQATGAGDQIAQLVSRLPVSPVLTAFLVAALVRVALGSATASILTASALMADVAKSAPGHETLFVLAVSAGVTVGTQPADSGFWMMREYGNLSVRDVLVRLNGCRAAIAVFGVALLLAAERWLVGR